MSWMSWDYFHLRPYPTHNFGPTIWPREKGPMPTPLPYVQILITEGAEFVFRNGAPAFSVPTLPDANAWLQKRILQNGLNAQWVSLAENAAHHGAIAVKFSVDMDNARCPVRITFLDVPQQCRVWTDPHDQTRILMARVQYPYRDPATNDWFYFREEWTDESYVTFVPKKAGDKSYAGFMQLPGYGTHLGDEGDWQIAKEETNELGLIPITIIRNRAVTGNPLGVGDCWQSFRLIDRLALTMHGEDKSNQFHSDPIPVAINARIDNEGPLQSGEPLSVYSDADGSPADMKLLEPSGAAREWTHRDLDRWEELVYKQAGISRVDPATVSNKGNMTALAFAMTFSRSIATSDRKRQQWGPFGMAVFFQNMLIGLERMGGVKELRGVNDDIQVSSEFPLYFGQTDEDKSTLSTRTIAQHQAGMIPGDKASERIAIAEGVPKHEVEKFVADAKTEREQKAAQELQAKYPDATAGAQAGSDLGDGDANQ